MRPTCVLGGYAEWHVAPEIASAVEAVWTYDAPLRSERGTPSTVHRVLPYTGVSLVAAGHRDRAGRLAMHALELQGSTSTHRFFRPSAGTALVAVRIRPEWVWGILGVDPSTLTDRIVEVHGDPGWRGPFTRMRRCACRSEVVAALAALVRDRLADLHPDGAAITVHHVLERLRRDRSSARVGELAGAVGVSERTVRRSVSVVTGMSAKWIQRVQRMNRVVTAADATQTPAWSELAYRFGFSDQPHLIREIRALSGCSPVELHRERTAEHEDFRLGREGDYRLLRPDPGAGRPSASQA